MSDLTASDATDASDAASVDRGREHDAVVPTTRMRLVDMTWPDAGALADATTTSVLVVPLGSCEQHGPHLPLDTDTRIAVALASALVHPPAASARSAPNPRPTPNGGSGVRLVLGPTIGIGASGEHESFPGTLSIGTIALEAMLVELVRSALPPPGSDRPRPFSGVVIVNGHGGNVEATARAAALLSDEGRAVLVCHPQIPNGDSHAGRTETSLLLHLDPSAVRADLIEPGSTARWRDIGDTIIASGLAAVTPNGILGDPTGATAEEGRLVFERLVGQMADGIRSWATTL